MKLPRDLSGRQLIKILEQYGYTISHQSGSHIRLTTVVPSQHHITIPDHAALKPGTLSAILSEVARHLDRSKQELVAELFG